MSELRGGSTVGGYSILHKGNPSELLDSLKTVDGVGSGLDADLLDGMAPATTNTASTIVQRDASGNFSAGTITATLSGNATTASSWETARTITLGGDLTGSVSVKGDANVTLTATVTDNSHNHGNATITDVDWSKVSNKPDPVITLTGDVTGSGTMTDVGSVSITTTVADSSHNHAWSNITSGTPTTLSGYGITDAVKMASVSYATPATAQWYRIAQSAVDIGRNAAIFEVEWTAGGVHGFAIFSATCMYGTTVSSGVDQISYGIYSTIGITKARVVYHTTYTANYAYLEIYLNTATATTLSIKANDSTGWTLITPIAGSIPAGYSSKEITFKAGVGTTGQIFSDVATGTAPLVVTSTTVVTNLNADLLDDMNTSTTATASTIATRDVSGNVEAYSVKIGIADTATAASHYMVETASDGYVRPKTLANVKTEIVTKAAVEAALTGAITTHTHSSYLPLAGGTLTGGLSGTTGTFSGAVTGTSFNSITGLSATTPTMDGTATIGTGTTAARADHIHPIDTSRAPLASPTFTGTPAAPTAADGTNTTQLATTAFVQGAVGGYLSKTGLTGGTITLTDLEVSNAVLAFSGTLTSNLIVVVPTTNKRLWAAINGTTGAFTLTIKTSAGTGVTVAQGKRNLIYTNGTNVQDAFNDFESIALTGTPTSTTAAVGTNTTQIATTAFVNAEIANDAPTKTGTGASGTWGISVTGSSASCTGNAATATKLATARTISLTGDVTGSATFDGSANASITATVANDSHTHTSATVPPGGIGGYQLFTTSGTFTVPTGVTSVYVTMCGGGGGGGGGDGASWAGAGGGGGGSYVNKQLTVTPGTGYTITIGAGGSGGAINANGSAGGSTSFGALLTAGGGGGGGTSAVNPTGGSAGTGDFKGRAGVYSSMDTTGVKFGGDSLFGFGGMTYGAPGTGYGGGGNGQTLYGSGGAGSPGFAIIMW